MKNNKYLENKIGLVNATIAGHCIGLSFVAQEKGAKDFFYSYEQGVRVRETIEKDLTMLYRYAYNQGKKEQALLQKNNIPYKGKIK